MEYMNGEWTITGLPEEYTVVEFIIAQIGSDLSGTLAINGPNGELAYTMTGTHIGSNVNMSLSREETVEFTFSGEFNSNWTVRGTLAGQFTGLAILSVVDTQNK